MNQALYEVIAKGKIDSDITDHWGYGIRNSSEMQIAWKKTFGDSSKPPKIDFKRTMVIAVYAPVTDRRHTINIDEIIETADCLEVKVTATTPEHIDSAKTMAYLFAKTKRYRMPISFDYNGLTPTKLGTIREPTWTEGEPPQTVFRELASR